MSRPVNNLLVLILAVAGLLQGCVGQTPAQVSERPAPAMVSSSPLQHWLDLQDTVAAMTGEQVNAALAGIERPADSDQRYYFALLNQHAGTYQGWTIARDAFRQLQQDDALPAEQRQLAAIFEQYNQSRINWHQRYGQLQAERDELLQQLESARQQQTLLEEKIQAITELEATISNRREVQEGE